MLKAVPRPVDLRLTTVLLGAVVVSGWLGGCSRCSSEVPEAREVDGSAALVWEQIELGVDLAGLRAGLAQMAGIPDEDASARIACNDQFTMDVVDPEERTIEERSGRGHALANCTLLRAGAGQSSYLVAVRGELLDGRLARLTFTFASDRFAALGAQLEARFAKGAALTLEERSAVLLDGTTAQSLVWRRGKELLALVNGEREVRLIRQDLALTEVLAPMPAAAERGKPVSLDDIGLGGGLELDAALPDLSDLVGGDR